MLGSLGAPELLLIFAVILIVFGPRKLPEIGRTLGKALGEFRKATDDLKNTIEREVRIEELKNIAPPSLESMITPPESVSRSEPVTPPAAVVPETNAATPALPESKDEPDTASVTPAAPSGYGPSHQ